MQQIKRFKDLSCPAFAYQDNWYASYDAPNPRTLGHKIFVPKENSLGFMNLAFNAAYKLGTTMVDMKRWSGFKLLVEYGESAGQTVGWPQIHLLPYPPSDNKI